jgi:large subunit ribosomal protein L12
MEYVYAALMLHNSKQEVNEANLKKVLSASGVAVDEIKLKQLVSALTGVNIDEAIKQAAVVAAAPVAAAAVDKKEEKKDEAAAEEQASAGLAALFG